MKYLFFLFSLFSFAQQTQYVDFKSVLGEITINTTDKAISGNIKYNFDVLKPIDTIKIDAQNMSFSDLKINGNEIMFINTNKQLQLIFPFQKGKNTLTFNYLAKPKQALYFINAESKDGLEIWTQGQGRYTSNWFPSFDDVNEKVVFNLDITFDKNYKVISNGVLKNKLENGNSFVWQYRMQNPMSSYLLMLAIVKYEEKELKSKSRIPLEYYIENNDISRFEPTYRYSKEIFDFLEKEIGVKYPWEIYRQAPVRDFIYAGMENTTATLFSTRYVVDSIGFEDRKYTNINAHELAHHWFGNLITAESSTHHWLQEGFATYYALLAEKEIYGEDYFYSKLYDTAQQLKYASRTDTIPVLNAKASSLTFYEKGAWALFVLHDALGDKIFKKVIKNYLKKYAYQTVNTDEFFEEIKKLSNYDLKEFSKVWLETTAFNTQQANELLSKNKAIQMRLEVDKVNKKPLSEKEAFLSKVLQSDVYFTVKKAIVNQLKNEKYEAKKQLLILALNTNDLQVRQEVAVSLPKIPEDFRPQYETLLNDKSYQTQEIALYYLWNNFPSRRSEYLDKSKNWIGFNDYNLKTLWLSLALSTPNYAPEPEILVNELIAYSSPKYEATTRQNALEKLIDFRLTNDIVLANLVNATTHHMWQFSKFGRDSIRLLLKNSEMRSSFERILPNLSSNEQFQLNRLLKE
ncbi:M1 family metallopeptidase [Flavobacterium hydatis]|uniref:Aminopeptidase N n=1 Tax=Flavobacterium hydatis TaxID=991 RepID=A0A086AEN7_FLAHY|nr:M1 family metallopeptidase [Flavobacterium hydatis]KFF15151.1 aminopeptidase [Flavobacterium hydatis]OXA91911.1 aminopeptidase [Flavobacterium hydatis]